MLADNSPHPAYTSRKSNEPSSTTGAVDQKILEGITGLWAFCAQFRRPMFSFLYDLYHQQSPGDLHTPFRLSREARNELLVLACLAPLCITDCTAASGAGACRAFVGSSVSSEIWQRGDKLGYRAPLLSLVLRVAVTRRIFLRTLMKTRLLGTCKLIGVRMGVQMSATESCASLVNRDRTGPTKRGRLSTSAPHTFVRTSRRLAFFWVNF